MVSDANIPAAPTDTLHIQGIRAYGYTGALPEENVLGQWFEANLALSLDLALAGQSDQLADTCNYAQVVQLTQQIIQTERCQLIERLAALIAEAVLKCDPRIQQVTVRLVKPTPPIPDFSGQVAVEICRDRRGAGG